MRLMHKRATIYIAPEVYYKMRALVEQCPVEIAWHGYVEKINDYTFLWYDIVVYPQYVSPVTTISDEEEYANWLIQQMERDDFSNLRLHGHSHVNMACGPSATDIKYREDLLSKITREDDFYIFLITNKQKQHTLEIQNFNTDLILDTSDVDIVIGDFKMNEVKKWADTNLNDFIKEEKCSTISRAKTTSTLKESSDPYTLSGAEQLVEPLLRPWLAPEYRE